MRRPYYNAGMHDPYLHALHEATRISAPVPVDQSKWPEAWKTVGFKQYRRFPSILLPEPTLSESTYADVLRRRSSNPRFDVGTSLPLQSLSDILYAGAGISRNKEHPERSFRFYPSGGARYPLELYLATHAVEGIPRSIYHYDVRRHALERVTGEDAVETIRAVDTYPWIRDAAVIGLVSAVLDRTTQKYGRRGYRFALIETGCLLHNLYLAASASGRGFCALGTDIDAAIESLLDLDTEQERYILGFAVGTSLPDSHA